MRFAVDTTSWYEWEKIEQDGQETDTPDGSVTVELADGSHGRRVLKSGEVRTTDGWLPEHLIAERMAIMGRKRNQVVAEYVQFLMESGHAPQDHWVAIRCDDPDAETFLQALYELSGQHQDHPVHPVSQQGELPATASEELA